MEGICQLCGKNKKLDKHHIDYKKSIVVNICRSCHSKIESLLKRFPRQDLQNPIKLTCKKCNHSWVYKGKNPYFATCPSCMRKVEVKKNEVKK